MVSAAIILDLVAQGKWDLDISLSEIEMSFGSEEIKNDTRYKKLTTRMIIAQSSALPNSFTATKFMDNTIPGEHFTYSGLAYEYLKEAVQITLGKTWGELAQDFFNKAEMEHSTFQLPEKTHLKESTIARPHTGDGTALSAPSPEDFKEIPAGSMLTTAEDYVCFLRYCYSHADLKGLLTSHTKLSPTQCPETPEAHQKITWGLGMGIFKDGAREIAFHWGNNTNSHAFCAMNIKTGGAVACFVNSANGPNVFQMLSEKIVGDMQPVFEWLLKYSNFKAAVESESPKELQAFFAEKIGDRESKRDQVSASVLASGGR